jgi:ATP-dependent 26S proteasome regulatory subunit
MKELINYIRAGFPVMVMNTVEVSRACEAAYHHIRKYNQTMKEEEEKAVTGNDLKAEGFSLFEWSVTSGWVDPSKEGEDRVNLLKGTDNPIRCLTFLTNEEHLAGSRGGIYMVQNLHLYWADPSHKPHITQRIIDFCKLRIPHRHVIFVGPVGEIPAEMSHLIMPVDFQLPTKEDLVRLADKFSAVIKRSGGKALGTEVKKTVAKAASGMTEYEAENAMRASLIGCGGKKIDPKTVQEEKAKAVKKAGFLEYEKVQLTIKDVGGLENLKLWLGDLARIYQNMDKALDYGLAVPKGTMVTGISGTGKSLIAKVISNMFGVPLFRCDIGKLFGSLVGETEKNTEYLFKQIDAVSPCVILLDEIEKSLSGLESSSASDAGVTARLIGRLLTYLQDKISSSFFVATANDITKLPPELLRKGRFNQIWFVDLPDRDEREAIFKIHLIKTKRKPEDYDLAALVKSTDGSTGAEIEGFITDAMYKAFAHDREYDTNDIKGAIDNTPLLSKTKEKEISKLRKWAKGRARIANYADDAFHPAWMSDNTGEDLLVDEAKPEGDTDEQESS